MRDEFEFFVEFVLGGGLGVGLEERVESFALAGRFYKLLFVVGCFWEVAAATVQGCLTHLFIIMLMVFKCK